MIGNILVLKVFKEKLNSFNTTICRLVKADSPNSVFGLVEEPRQAKVKKDQRSQSSPKKRNQKGYCQTIDGQRLLRPFLAGNDWSPIEMSRLWRSPKTTAATISTIKQPRGCWRLLPTALLATVTQWSHMAETCQKKLPSVISRIFQMKFQQIHLISVSGHYKCLIFEMRQKVLAKY